MQVASPVNQGKYLIEVSSYRLTAWDQLRKIIPFEVPFESHESDH